LWSGGSEKKLPHKLLHIVPINWYKLLIKTLSSALKPCSHNAPVTWKTRNFRHFTSEQHKLTKSEVVEKIIPVADFLMSADDVPKIIFKRIGGCVL